MECRPGCEHLKSRNANPFAWYPAVLDHRATCGQSLLFLRSSATPPRGECGGGGSEFLKGFSVVKSLRGFFWVHETTAAAIAIWRQPGSLLPSGHYRSGGGCGAAGFSHWVFRSSFFSISRGVSRFCGQPFLVFAQHIFGLSTCPGRCHLF